MGSRLVRAVYIQWTVEHLIQASVHGYLVSSFSLWRW